MTAVLDVPLTQLRQAASCASCSAAIIWATTGAGKAMPVDAMTVADGNIAVSTTLPIVKARYLRKSEQPGPAEWRGVSHFATCPNSDQHRQPKPAAAVFRQPADGTHRPPVTGPAGEIAAHVTDVMHRAMKSHPRSLQAAPGPSELGTPCVRRLAYKLLDWDRPNDDRDQWLSTIGTAVHAWQADIFEAENRRIREEKRLAGCGPAILARDRYLIEQRVHLPEGISGSCDLYDRDQGDVVDWKVTSPDRIKKYARHGPGDQYRTQAHLYGLGWLLAGENPQRVAIVFLPRGGLLTGLHVWTEPFDPKVAVAAIKRYQTTVLALAATDPERNPANWGLFPTTDAFCTWCPYHLPHSSDLGKGCPGHQPNK